MTWAFVDPDFTRPPSEVCSTCHDVSTPTYNRQDWTRAGRLEDFAHAFADWHFDWLDIPELIATADEIWEYPMVDRDPLEAEITR